MIFISFGPGEVVYQLKDWGIDSQGMQHAEVFLNGDDGR